MCTGFNSMGLSKTNESDGETGRCHLKIVNVLLIKATFEQLEIAAEGIHSIFVNGTPVWSNGNHTGQHPGVFPGK